MKKKKPRRTSYYVAVNYLNNSYILCNNITEIDPSVYDNMRFSYYDEDDNAIDIYQWYLTSAYESDVEWLEKSFGLLFTYSDLLDCFVLCVDHFGTSWHGVSCDCFNDDIPEEYLKDKDGF